MKSSEFSRYAVPAVFVQAVILIITMVGGSSPLLSMEPVFPGQDWEQRTPGEVQLDETRLDRIATGLGGRGCVIKSGFVVKTWGDQSKRSDLFSSAKPILTTLLMFALQEGKVTSFDQRIADFGWPLSAKDQSITFRHLANMTSGYARPEEPGQAWAYNDYAIQLYQQTLFDKVFMGAPEEVFHDPARFGKLGLQDGFVFRKKNRRMSASVRDFARIAWFWRNHGNWRGEQLIPAAWFDQEMRAQVAINLPLSREARTDDYLQIGTYGGESNHDRNGPGIYGFNWWFNSSAPQSSESLNWPDAPVDTVMSIGFRGNCSVVIPSLDLVVVALEADWGTVQPGKSEGVMNQRLKSITLGGTTGVTGEK